MQKNKNTIENEVIIDSKDIKPDVNQDSNAIFPAIPSSDTYEEEPPSVILDEEIHPDSIPDETFCNDIAQLKFKIYNLIVIDPTKDKIESKDAQDMTLLNTYIDVLNYMHKVIIQKNNIDTVKVIPRNDTSVYSKKADDTINDTINYTTSFFTNNGNINKQIYKWYLYKTFITYPFVQLPSFPQYH